MKQYIGQWQFFAFGSAFFAALTAILGKCGVTGINSNFATFIRTVVILIVTALLVTMRSEWQKPAQLPKAAVAFLILSGVATGLSWLCYYRALQLGQASRVAPVDKLSVVLVMIFSTLFLRESLTWVEIAGGGFITAGAVMIALG